MWELQHGPAGLALTILELRSYARAKERVDYADDHPDDESISLGDLERYVQEIQDCVMEQRLDEMKRQRGAISG